METIRSDLNTISSTTPSDQMEVLKKSFDIVKNNMIKERKKINILVIKDEPYYKFIFVTSSYRPDGIPESSAFWSIALSCHDRLPVPRWILAGIKSSPTTSEPVIIGSSSGVKRQTKVAKGLEILKVKYDLIKQSY